MAPESLSQSSYRFSDLVDLPSFFRMLENFYDATGIPNGLVDNEGQIIGQFGWTDSCSLYHRVHAESAKNCLESNISIMRKLQEGKVVCEQCQNGLFDCATPIVIEGKKIATLFMGQVLYDRPDMAFFESQAGQFGFDKNRYLESIKEVPVVDKKRISSYMNVMVSMAEMLAENGLARVRQSAMEIERREAALKLEESQNRLLGVLQTMPDMVWLKDMEGNYKFCNHAFERLVGASEAEIVGKKDHDLFDREFAEFFRQKDIEAIDAGRVLINEEYVEYSDTGEQGILETRKVPVYGQDGIMNGVLGVARDITDRKQAESKLHAQGEEIRALVENSPDAIVRYNADLKCIYENPAAKRLFDRPVENLIFSGNGGGVRSFKNFESMHESVFQKKEAIQIEISYEKENGENRWLDLSLVPEFDSIGNVCAILIIGRDTTEKKLLQYSHEIEFLIHAINQSSEMIFLIDTSFRFTYVNDAACGILGYKRIELLSMTMLDIDPTLTSEKLSSMMGIIQSGRKLIFETKHRVSDGGIIPVELSSTLVEHCGKQYSLIVGRDVSRRKQYEAAREAALEEARRMADVRSEFLARMSHELRNPLNGILGYARILCGDRTLDEQQLEGVDVIRQSGEHLLGLINDILDVARGEVGRIELFKKDIPLQLFLNGIVSIVKLNAGEKGLDFTAEFSPDLPEWIHTDEKRLRQVLLNLLTNAIKFTEVGYVKLRVDCLPLRGLLFEVYDSGIGIAVGKVDSIFRPFEQVSEKRFRSEGAGLGLAISRQIVNLMGGDIVVESKQGKGSIFKFEIDPNLDSVKANKREEKQIIYGYSGERKKILVVDDQRINRMIIIAMLKSVGFIFEEAENGIEAIEKVKKEKPHLVLMDRVMPELDGLEATQHLRTMPGCETLPVIIVSAGVFNDEKEDCFVAGADAFLPKPVEKSYLMDQIGHLLGLEWIYESSISSNNTPISTDKLTLW